MQLKTVQQQFQDYVLGSSERIVDTIDASTQLTKVQSLQIYQNSYYERSIQALTQDFPVLSHAIGHAAFSSLIRDYLDDYPSRHFNLRFLGKYLSQFILSKQSDFLPYAELAELEWLIDEIKITVQNERVETTFSTAFNVVQVWQQHQENVDRVLSALSARCHFLVIVERGRVRFMRAPRMIQQVT